MPKSDELKDFAPVVRSFLIETKRRHQLGVLANRLGIQPPRLSELLYERRKVTAYYLSKFVEVGVMTIEELLAGRELSDLDPPSQMFILRQRIPEKTIRLLNEVIDSGYSINNIDRTFRRVLTQAAQTSSSSLI